jgi:phosphoribosylaminoimidazolecarboxamide formyltransferase / IMP cyclohydrolase
VGAVEQALTQACDEAYGAALASDGFFPAIDNIQMAAQARVGVIIQPGGSIKDKDVIALCNQYDIPLLLTGVREFKH